MFQLPHLFGVVLLRRSSLLPVGWASVSHRYSFKHISSNASFSIAMCFNFRIFLGLCSFAVPVSSLFSLPRLGKAKLLVGRRLVSKGRFLFGSLLQLDLLVQAHGCLQHFWKYLGREILVQQIGVRDVIGESSHRHSAGSSAPLSCWAENHDRQRDSKKFGAGDRLEGLPLDVQVRSRSPIQLHRKPSCFHGVGGVERLRRPHPPGRPWRPHGIPRPTPTATKTTVSWAGHQWTPQKT